MMFRLYDFGSVVYLAYFSARILLCKHRDRLYGYGKRWTVLYPFLMFNFLTWRYSRTSK